MTDTYTETEKLLAKGMVLCSDATHENDISTGDPTEVALLMLADTIGLERKKLEENTTRIAELPFDSERKLMSVQVEENGEKTVFTKGAIDNILGISTHILRAGNIEKITEKDRENILREMGEMSD